LAKIFSYKLLFKSFLIINYKFNIFNNDEFKIEKYLKICNDTKAVNEKYFKNKQKPKVSIISSVYNREKYLIRFINSIQNQKMKDIELIFIDDFSRDNSIKIIENFQKKDERILLIKNKKNKGTFICRNLGVMKSRGEYLILPDPDDILSRDIIYICYNFAKKYNFEMLRFNIYLGKGNIFLNHSIKYLRSRPIFQPELSIYLFYGLGKLRQIDFNVSNKFVKRVSFIRALNCINKYYLYFYMVAYDDGLMNFFLYRTVKSFFFLKKIGYYYIRNKKTGNEIQKSRVTRELNFIFIYLKLVFEFTKNTLIERNISNSLMRNIYNIHLSNQIIIFDKDLIFYNDVINNFLNCTFINKRNKNYLKKLYIIINDRIKNYIANKTSRTIFKVYYYKIT
jgi:glycosyltransferase involved in cell wall biosynthesis